MMQPANARQKASFSAVVRNADGTIKRDYGVVCRTHPNPVMNSAYWCYYWTKRKVIDAKIRLTKP